MAAAIAFLMAVEVTVAPDVASIAATVSAVASFPSNFAVILFFLLLSAALFRYDLFPSSYPAPGVTVIDSNFPSLTVNPTLI